MRAAWYEKTGPAADVLVVGEMDTPEPGDGEVLVRLQASGVNPSDVKARAGLRGGSSSMPYPRVVPHSDGAGIIERVGAGVSPGRVGERVWVWNGQWQRAFGTAAEYIAVPSEQAVALRDGIDYKDAASFGIPGLTAAHCVMGNGAVAGQSVLIHGGAGTVGYLMVQLAALNGARVIATVGSEADIELVKSAGAEEVFLYRDPDLENQMLEASSGDLYDRIIDVEFGVNIGTTAALVKPRGRIVAFGSAKVLTPELPFYPLLFKGVNLEFVLIYLLTAPERSAAAECLYNALKRGELNIPIGGSFSLDQVAKAHEMVEAGGRSGAVIIEME